MRFLDTVACNSTDVGSAPAGPTHAVRSRGYEATFVPGRRPYPLVESTLSRLSKQATPAAQLLSPRVPPDVGTEVALYSSEVGSRTHETWWGNIFSSEQELWQWLQEI